jgi:hypothetical protein
MYWRPWKAGTCPAAQEMPYLFCSPEFLAVFTRTCSLAGGTSPRLFKATLLRCSLILLWYLHLRLPSAVLPSLFSTKMSYWWLTSPICPLPPVQFILPHLITSAIFDEVLQLWISPLFNILHPPLTYCTLGPVIFIFFLSTNRSVPSLDGLVLHAYKAVSVGRIMWEMKKCYLEWVSRGISYTK